MKVKPSPVSIERRKRTVIINYAAVARRIGCSRAMVHYVITGARKSKRLEAEIKSLLKVRSLKSIIKQEEK